MRQLISLGMLVLIGAVLGGCKGNCGGTCGPCDPQCSPRKDVTPSIRFIQGAGRADPAIPQIDVFFDDVMKFANIFYLAEDCGSRYINNVLAGIRNIDLNESGTANTLYRVRERIYFDVLTMFSYPTPVPAEGAGPPETRIALVILSDDQSTTPITNSKAAVRAVFLSQRLVATANAAIDIYLRSCATTGELPVKVLDGSGKSKSDAVPNWTEIGSDGTTLQPGQFLTGILGLSSYVRGLTPGRYEVIAVPAGGDARTGNLIRPSTLILCPNTYYTIVVADRNCTPTGVCIKVYTDISCCSNAVREQGFDRKI